MSGSIDKVFADSLPAPPARLAGTTALVQIVLPRLLWALPSHHHPQNFGIEIPGELLYNDCVHFHIRDRFDDDDYGPGDSVADDDKQLIEHVIDEARAWMGCKARGHLAAVFLGVLHCDKARVFRAMCAAVLHELVLGHWARLGGFYVSCFMVEADGLQRDVQAELARGGVDVDADDDMSGGENGGGGGAALLTCCEVSTPEEVQVVLDAIGAKHDDRQSSMFVHVQRFGSDSVVSGSIFLVDLVARHALGQQYVHDVTAATPSSPRGDRAHNLGQEQLFSVLRMLRRHGDAETGVEASTCHLTRLLHAILYDRCKNVLVARVSNYLQDADASLEIIKAVCAATEITVPCFNL